jgi:hypothetical protein
MAKTPCKARIFKHASCGTQDAECVGEVNKGGRKMRYENTFEPKSVMNKMIFNRPRNALSKYASTAMHNSEEESGGDEDDPDD